MKKQAQKLIQNPFVRRLGTHLKKRRVHCEPSDQTKQVRKAK